MRIVFFIVVLLLNCLAQDDPVNISIHADYKNKYKLILNADKSFVNYGDTIHYKIHVENNSSDSVLVYDPSFYGLRFFVVEEKSSICLNYSYIAWEETFWCPRMMLIKPYSYTDLTFSFNTSDFNYSDSALQANRGREFNARIDFSIFSYHSELKSLLSGNERKVYLSLIALNHIISTNKEIFFSGLPFYFRYKD